LGVWISGLFAPEDDVLGDDVEPEHVLLDDEEDDI